MEKFVGLSKGTVLHHVSLLNADNTPLRCRVNGKMQMVRGEFRLPVKYGLYRCFYITQDNADKWIVPQSNRIAA